MPRRSSSGVGMTEKQVLQAHQAFPLPLATLDQQTPFWIARRVEVHPSHVDGEIIYVTPAMERLYGYRWPDTLVGQRIADLHLRTDAQITRQYAFLRLFGYPVPQHYVMHGLHPNGRLFRVVKHVGPYHIGPLMTWSTHHEPWRRSTPYPVLVPPAIPPWLRGIVLYDEERQSAAHPQVPPLPFTTLLRRARQTQHLSFRALALQCTHQLGPRVTPQHLSNLEHGHRQSSLALLQALATVLALDPSVLAAALLRPTSSPPPARATARPTEHALQETLAHVQRAAQHLAQAQQAYHGALLAAQQAGHSLRQLAAVTGLSPSRIRQLLAPSPDPLG